MKKEKNVFITDDINIVDYEYDNVERYDFTRQKLNPNDYDFSNFRDWLKEKRKEDEGFITESGIEILNKMKDEKLPSKFYLQYEDYLEEFEEWANNNLDFEELYEVPMMNALRYYPSFCSFTKEDRYKTNGCITLLYDRELESWAIGMAGGGMDLSPQLLATFINLEKGIPSELAQHISPTYNANVDEETHKENCILLAKAYREEAQRNKQRAKDLEE